MTPVCWATLAAAARSVVDADEGDLLLHLFMDLLKVRHLLTHGGHHEPHTFTTSGLPA